MLHEKQATVRKSDDRCESDSSKGCVIDVQGALSRVLTFFVHSCASLQQPPGRTTAEGTKPEGRH